MNVYAAVGSLSKQVFSCDVCQRARQSMATCMKAFSFGPGKGKRGPKVKYVLQYLPYRVLAMSHCKMRITDLHGLHRQAERTFTQCELRRDRQSLDFEDLALMAHAQPEA